MKYFALSFSNFKIFKNFSLKEETNILLKMTNTAPTMNVFSLFRLISSQLFALILMFSSLEFFILLINKSAISPALIFSLQ